MNQNSTSTFINNLVSGQQNWKNVPYVVRITLKTMHDTILTQQLELEKLRKNQMLLEKKLNENSLKNVVNSDVQSKSNGLKNIFQESLKSKISIDQMLNINENFKRDTLQRVNETNRLVHSEMEQKLQNFVEKKMESYENSKEENSKIIQNITKDVEELRESFQIHKKKLTRKVNIDEVKLIVEKGSLESSERDKLSERNFFDEIYTQIDSKIDSLKVELEDKLRKFSENIEDLDFINHTDLERYNIKVQNGIKKSKEDTLTLMQRNSEIYNKFNEKLKKIKRHIEEKMDKTDFTMRIQEGTSSKNDIIRNVERAFNEKVKSLDKKVNRVFMSGGFLTLRDFEKFSSTLTREIREKTINKSEFKLLKKRFSQYIGKEQIKAMVEVILNRKVEHLQKSINVLHSSISQLLILNQPIVDETNVNMTSEMTDESLLENSHVRIPNVNSTNEMERKKMFNNLKF